MVCTLFFFARKTDPIMKVKLQNYWEMFNMTKVIEMENTETIIEEVTEVKDEQEGLELDYSLSMIGSVALAGAAKQLADKGLYGIGVGVGLLFGKKAAINTMGLIVGANAVYNVARYVSGELKVKKKKK